MENDEQMDPIEALLQKLSEGKLTAVEKSYLFDWIRNNRQKWALSLYDEYRQMVENEETVLSEEKSKQILRDIHLELTKDGNLHKYTGSGNTRSKTRWFRPYAAAAAAVLVALTATWFYRLKDITVKSSAGSSQVAAAPGHLNVVHNTGKQVIPVALPDGSNILLHPSSRISYPDSFGVKREVMLSGKAFFEIVKQPDAPFYVYANEMVTRVLGTSFLIEAFENDPHFSVEVKTGEVSVSASEKIPETTHQLPAVKLKASEKIMLDRSIRKFVSLTPDIPADLKHPDVQQTLETYRFHDTPVAEILNTLSKDYEVVIRLTGKSLSDCSLTTTLKDKTLYEKLKIICEGIGPGTSFTISDGKVIIHSPGCNQ